MGRIVPRRAEPARARGAVKIARRELVLFAVIAAGTTLLACTLLLDDSQVQCASTADCRARGPAFANAVCVASVCQQGDAGAASDAGSGPWDCLEGPPIPSPVGMSTSRSSSTAPSAP